MVIGVLQLDVHVPTAQSLKDKRSVIKRLKDQLRGRFNVAVAELDANETWQRATIGVSAIGEQRAYVEGLLTEVTEWLRATRLVELSRVQQECW
ncbi:MAG: DUF503 domain-containing protein [Candidatus Omnitrophica bacterium]|nr:DUF503 domain-containing protein [Candidatus Omnitrophota bacterium]